MYRDRKDDNFNKSKRYFDRSNSNKRNFEDRDDFKRENENQPDKDIIFGRNSVSEAIKAERPLDSILVASSSLQSRMHKSSSFYSFFYVFNI